jgi:hypothetical protein
MEMAEAQLPTFHLSFYPIKSSNSPLVMASHKAQLQVKEQGSVVFHHEALARLWRRGVRIWGW